jgi:superfamily II DNA/RNA helicase
VEIPTDFDGLGLSPEVVAAVKDRGYTTPTPIQAQAIPHVLAHRDVLGIAQTGTGKTGAFCLPMIDRLGRGRARARMPRSLILEPTRELAAQVAEAFELYGKNHKFNVALLIGGVSFGDQDAKLGRGVDVLIATPGRLLDHFERGKLLMNGVETLVIDEADRMLDMGFIPDVERICKMIPFTRQTLFFSATMPPEIQRLVDTFLQNPVRIEVARPATTAENIAQSVVQISSAQKRGALRTLLQRENVQNGIIFCNRKSEVAILHGSLKKHGFNAGALHGDMDQRSRMATLEAFRNGEIALLVASDVAARGLDIPAVSHVFNFDVPINAEDYVHRIGRTGRAGRSGKAITFATSHDRKNLAAIEKLIGSELPVEIVEGLEAAVTEDDAPATRTPRGRRDRSKDRDRTPKPRVGAPEAATTPLVQLERQAQPERQSQPERQPRPERAPRPEREPRQERDRSRRPSRRDQDTDGPSVVGLGAHVPAFLLQPLRPAPSRSHDEDAELVEAS